jgi:hypothetical protein
MDLLEEVVMAEMGLSRSVNWSALEDRTRSGQARAWGAFATALQTIFGRFMAALHESRRLTAEREIARHRHLISKSDA